MFFHYFSGHEARGRFALMWLMQSDAGLTTASRRLLRRIGMRHPGME
jgi:hypothetical protein